jgi:hypothetical protein
MSKKITVLRDEELSAVSGAADGVPAWLLRKAAASPSGYVNVSKGASQYLVVDGNVFIERGPGSLHVTIGDQTVSA